MNMIKKILFIMLSVSGLATFAYSQSEAGALFLLIAPGARAGGMGEAQVAIADDAYASFWNPAGLGFLRGRELAFMHVNWLPGLVSDIYYEFLAYRQFIPDLGTVGGHIIYLDLGEQIRTGEKGEELGTFVSYMTAATFSYGTDLSRNSTLGLNIKLVYQHLADYGAGKEKGSGTSTNFGFDIGYMKKKLLTPRLDIGLTITNIGPKVVFIDPAQGDPMPTNFRFGFNYYIFKGEFNKLSFAVDFNKLLVAAYPNTDINGNGFIDPGTKEEAHSDPWYLAIFTSWFNDWKYKGDIDSDDDSKITGDEVGSKNRGSFQNELDEIWVNAGIEYWYSDIFALRAGYLYDKLGKIANPTFGAGIRYANYGFDFGFTSGEQGHPLTNTMRFSLSVKF
jgi:hypothetical protein